MNTLKLLLVDDNSTHRLLVKRMLAETEPNARVTEAQSAHEAIEMLADGSFDCALVDFRLLDGDAFDILRELADTGSRPSIPVFVLTSMTDEKIGNDLISAGAEGYMVKSEVLDGKLTDAMRSALERYRRQDDQLEGDGR